MEIFDLLDAARRRINVLEHPFYERWSAGELAPEELSFYAGEYRHAVGGARRCLEPRGCCGSSGARAHAGAPRCARRPATLSCGTTSRAQSGAEAGADAQPLQQTRECAASWTAGEDLLEHLAVLYTVEASQPAISTTKLEGLTTHYGLAEDSPGLGYFKLHATLDVGARAPGARADLQAGRRGRQRADAGARGGGAGRQLDAARWGAGARRTVTTAAA